MTFTSTFIFVFVTGRFNFYKKCFIMYASLLSGQASATTSQDAPRTSIGEANEHPIPYDHPSSARGTISISGGPEARPPWASAQAPLNYVPLALNVH
jgi:hypothetical protein